MLKALHHVRIGVTDLIRTAQFAADFGLTVAHQEHECIYFRGAGSDAYNLIVESSDTAKLLAIGFALDNAESLDIASQSHGVPITDLPMPFGGRAITLRDPDNNRIDLIVGVDGRTADALRPGMVVNHGHAKERRGATQTKRALGAPQLMRLGHVGLFVSNYPMSDTWYREVLGLIPSDLMHAGPPGNVIAGFYRIDRGSEWVDHHTLAMFGMGRRGLHHMSFEVQDSETQFMAHRWMKQRGHTPVWGVGRHQLGSHIFDVWRDPDGNRFETYSDTDLLTAEAKPALSPIETVGLDLWSNEHFQKYFD